MSWLRLISERLAALVAGVLVITAESIAGLVLGATSAGASLSGPGLLRLTAVTVLLGTALGAVAAVVVARLPGGLAVTVLAVFGAACYLLTYLVQLSGRPGWVSKLSVFGAFGRPYLEPPTAAGFAVLAGLAVGGTLLAVAVARRSPRLPDRRWPECQRRPGRCQRVMEGSAPMRHPGLCPVIHWHLGGSRSGWCHRAHTGLPVK